MAATRLALGHPRELRAIAVWRVWTTRIRRCRRSTVGNCRIGSPCGARSANPRDNPARLGCPQAADAQAPDRPDGSDAEDCSSMIRQGLPVQPRDGWPGPEDAACNRSARASQHMPDRRIRPTRAHVTGHCPWHPWHAPRRAGGPSRARHRPSLRPWPLLRTASPHRPALRLRIRLDHRTSNGRTRPRPASSLTSPAVGSGTRRARGCACARKPRRCTARPCSTRPPSRGSPGPTPACRACRGRDRRLRSPRRRG